MLYKTLNRPRRFRYHNGSPKQRKFAGGHRMVTGKIERVEPSRWQRDRTVRFRQPFPARFRRSEIGASAAYQKSDGQGREVRIFADVCVRGQTSKAARYWKTALSGMKAEAMVSEPTRTWRKSPKRKARRHARGSGGKPRYSRRGVRL